MITKREYSTSDANPSVLYAKRDGDSTEAYPITADEYGVLKISEHPSTYRMKIAYDVSYRQQYIGYAPRGTETDEALWIIHKLTYDGTTPRLTDRDIAVNAIWDNRATETYS